MIREIDLFDNDLRPVYEYEVQYLFDDENRPCPNVETYKDKGEAFRVFINIATLTNRNVTFLSISRKFA